MRLVEGNGGGEEGHEMPPDAWTIITFGAACMRGAAQVMPFIRGSTTECTETCKRNVRRGSSLDCANLRNDTSCTSSMTIIYSVGGTNSIIVLRQLQAPRFHNFVSTARRVPPMGCDSVN